MNLLLQVLSNPILPFVESKVKSQLMKKNFYDKLVKEKLKGSDDMKTEKLIVLGLSLIHIFLDSIQRTFSPPESTRTSL